MNMMPVNEVQSIEELEEYQQADDNLPDKVKFTIKVSEHEIEELYPTLGSASNN